MNLKSGYPFWLIKSGLPFNYRQLKKSICADIAILGGGISGALVAYELVQKGIDCIVVDKYTISSPDL
ncbi:MAG: FAD-binding oxidoreductase [Chitinophagaceae bacterium]|nr:FAD-binding oxidoreductase [Chitinophagaceae bacterium]